MGYRTNYAPIKQTHICTKRLCITSLLTVLFMVVFCLLVNSMWSAGTAVLKHFLFSEEVAVFASRLEDLVQKLQTGEQLGDMFSVFMDDLRQFVG